MDIATLGLEVRSDQVEKGTASLDRLSRAASRAQAAAMGVATGSRQAAAGSASVASSSSNAAGALDREAAAARRAQQALERQATASRAANDNARRMGGSMSGLAAQFQDIGVTAAMGMNPAIIALQQGTQIAGQMEMAMQGGAKATDVLGTAFRSLFSPLTFITIALTALAAAGLQLVDWTALAGSALNGLASILQTVAPYAAMAAAGLALIYAPAILGGIVSVIALLGRLSVAAVTAAATMAAANPAAAFVLGITAAVAAANIFRDELTRIFGVDIVGAAKAGVNTVIAIFHGGYEGIVAAWNNLPAALGDLAYRAGYQMADGIRYWINEALILVGNFISSLNERFNTSIGVPNLLGPLANNNPYAGAASGVAGDITAAIEARMGTDYLGNIGGAISTAASGAADKLRELAGGFTSVEEAAGKAGKGAKDALDKTKKSAEDAAAKMQEAMLGAANRLGQGFGGIMNGLINKTMDWKDAALAAAQSVLKYLNDMNLAQGGKGLFGGGFFQNLIGGLLGIGFASGGYTGNRGAGQVAGVVHGQEYVFSAAATRKLGVGNLDAMHRAAKGYQSGGYVTPAMPRMQSPANDQPLRLEIVSRFDADGGFESAVERTSRPIAQVESQRAAGQVARAVPSMTDAREEERRMRRIRPSGGV